MADQLCTACGGRGWHTAGGGDPAACGACPAGEVWYHGQLCDRCGKPDDDHAFAELLHCLYADAGLTREQAGGIVDRITAEVAEDAQEGGDR